MNVDCILALLQSFVINARNSRFPEKPLSIHEFAFKKPCDQDMRSVWDKACANLRCMLMLPQAGLSGPGNMRAFACEILHMWNDGNRQIAFRTSGTTGKPKICVHSEEDLNVEANFLKNFFKNQSVFVSAVPPHHMYGFTFGLYLPYVMHRAVQRCISLPAIFYSELRNGTAGIGLPHFYEMAIPPPAPQNAMLVCASSPVSDHALMRVKKQGYEILDIFGSSETGVLGYRHTPGDPYELAPYYERRGKEVFRRNATSPAQIMDSLDWIDERKFHPQGRKDRMCQVAGMNVSLEAVERKVLAIDGVAACAVRLMRPDEGKRLKVFIVPQEKSGMEKLSQAIFSSIQAFPVQERPGRIDFGSEIPRNSMGKLCDW